MTIYWRPSIYYNSTIAHIPPFAYVARPAPISVRTFQTVPYGGIVETYGRQHGMEWLVTGHMHFDTIADARTLEALLLATMQDSNGVAREFEFCRGWEDSTGTIKDIYRGCVMSQDLVIDTPRSSKYGEFSFGIRTGNLTPYATFADGETPGAGPYEQYIYGGTPTGEAVYVVHDLNKMPIDFFGLAEVTDANNIGSMQFKLWAIHPTQAFKVKSIELAGSVPGTTGSDTSIVVSDSPYSTPPPAGNYIQIDVDGALASKTTVAGEFTVAGGAPVYVYFTAVAGHSDCKVVIGVEPA